MDLYFKTLFGHTCLVSGFHPEHTIEHLKHMLVPHLDNKFCACDLRMIFAGRSLEDGRTLVDYNI